MNKETRKQEEVRKREGKRPKIIKVCYVQGPIPPKKHPQSTLQTHTQNDSKSKCFHIIDSFNIQF